MRLFCDDLAVGESGGLWRAFAETKRRRGSGGDDAQGTEGSCSRDLPQYAWQDELSAAEFQAALDTAKQDAERVRKEFVESLPPGSPAYDAEWTSRYGSKDRLIFEFSVVLDLDGEDFDIRDYPGEAADNATADLRRRIAGTKVGKWGVFVVTVTGRPRPSSDD